MARKTHDRLFDRIANFQALRTAARKAIKGKRNKPAPAAFMANQEKELLRLERELRDGSYKPGGYVTIFIKDPKSRMVSAAPFRDRVVHHALCAVIEPIFERGFIYDSYANRSGKGTHRAVARYERFRDRSSHVLRCDIHRYFPSIDHEILKRDVRRRVACERTLRLIDTIIDGSNPQEPVHIHYPGDDLLTPFERKRGLPIGNLTSQFFANLYLDGLDHFVKEKLRAKGYVRYVDDFALFHDDPATLESWRQSIGVFLEGRRLSLHADKTFVQRTSEPAPFLGYVLYAGYRGLPEDNVRRFRNRLRGLRDRLRAGTATNEEIEQKIGAWIAHAAHANTWRLRNAIFQGETFRLPLDPNFRDGQSGPKRKPGRSRLATACCAAAPGTTIRGTSARPIATGTTPTIETTTTGSVLPARP